MSEPNWEYLLSEQVRQNGRLFYQLAYLILRDGAAAQDVCQQAFQRAWEHRDRIDPSGRTLKSWIAQTVKTECLQRVRREKIEQRALANHVAVRPDSADDPRENLERREAILAAIALLPERTRSIIELRFLNEMSSKEITILYGCSASDVWRELQRGFEQLRGLLSPDEHDDRQSS
jgi:RNA polymerase sigma-70 factor (ECF subfamily)